MKFWNRQPLARRIVVAFTVMTLVVSGTLSLALVRAVHVVEETLVSRALGKTLNHILDEDLPQGKPLHLDHDTRFFASDRPEYAIPPELAAMKPGFNEMEEEQFWVYVREVDGQRYMLMQDQLEFEEREDRMFAVLMAGFVFSVLAACVLGLLTARRVMSPVARLADEVHRRDPLSLPDEPLAAHYANDEIGRLAASFDDAMRRLGHAMERERLFTSDVSHELRTPLMIVSTSCELLQTGNLNAHEREQVERIARAAGEMQSLVATFLMLARAHPEASSPAGTALGDDTSLAAMAEEQRQFWAEKIRARGIEFGFVEEGRDTGRYNASLLRAVMGNLLRNALHYTDRGQIRLILEAGGFRVEDTGTGISEAERERVFRDFVRGSQARGEGLGLGLSLVRRICAHQGWEIAVDAAPEGGSRFRVRFCGK